MTIEINPADIGDLFLFCFFIKRLSVTEEWEFVALQVTATIYEFFFKMNLALYLLTKANLHLLLIIIIIYLFIFSSLVQKT